MPDYEAVADEYRVAYEQLKHCEKQMEQVLDALNRDHGLAFRRYEVAREAYLMLALGEDDGFLKAEE